MTLQLFIENFINDPFVAFGLLCIIFLIICAVNNFLSGRKGTWSPEVETISLGKAQLSSTQLQNQMSSNKPPAKKSKGETECKRVLESIFGMPFNSVRPDFLRNKVTGGLNNLELDCYNEQLGIALEYQGVQHVKYTPYFHKNKEAFLNQKYRDDMKRRICRDHDIFLIEVPHTVNIKDIRSFIMNELRNLKLFWKPT